MTVFPICLLTLEESIDLFKAVIKETKFNQIKKLKSRFAVKIFFVYYIPFFCASG